MTALVLPDARAWMRLRHGAVLTGSCRALATALGLPVRAVRIVFLLGAALTIPAIPMLASDGASEKLALLAMGIGAPLLVGYLALWWALPLDRAEERQRALEASASTVRGRPTAARGLPGPSRALGQLTRWLMLAGVVGLAITVSASMVVVPIAGRLIGVSDVFASAPPGYRGLVIAATGVLAAGLALGILPLDAVERARWGGSIRSMPRLILVALGTAFALLLVGAVWLVTLLFGGTAALIVLVVAVAVVGLLAVILIPWGRHLWNGMREETEQRALVQQRSEFTAHLHDSVLQTLTLLQKDGADPEEMRRLARRQERELRRWLFGSGEDGAELTDLRAAVTALCEDVEDRESVAVSTVVIGDAPVTDAMRPLLSALREALVNACRHGRVGVDVFVDASGTRVEAFVRDRGPGFDLADVPSDRMGVRQSIIGRMHRAGGSGTIRRAPGGGTEVALALDARSPGR